VASTLAADERALEAGLVLAALLEGEVGARRGERDELVTGSAARLKEA
jgi:hypothetical protein